ncbi:hypothetical protein Rumeso_03597 [Rubellimicrobium mesophilum DSM 19309]|uniref:AAA+ ATPase domain-containing protein n=1 Tax=Rubellimicrobium mesophilum DSM 19309 TaxID=442562 RepID=A0A017HKH4_9RHOB|nr:AAA family ATPase [Rubellimicrobium mesophilum]EYD74830.1 hypothetical protein Rumeso_03597 [Rubellimicrobium mesophilum DSM 19309]
MKISRRIERILKARDKASGLKHVRAEVAARFQPVLRGVELAGPANEHEADEIAARLFEEMPWHGRVIEILWRDMRQGARDGEGLRFRPLLLDGPPGAGKTTLALRLAELARVPYAYVDVATSSEGFNLSGAQRTWSSSAPGKPVETILETRIANPLLVVDEAEKGSTLYSAKGGVPTSAHQALLSLLEPTTARVWECPWCGLRLDISYVNWILTANDTRGLPAPLRSRLRLVAVRSPTHRELMAFAARELARRGLAEDALDTVETLVRAYPEGDERLSLRTVVRIVDDLAAIAETMEVQH